MERITDSQRKAIADKWCGEACTLNGKPAKIVGSANTFMKIVPLDSSVGGFEWPFETIDETMSDTDPKWSRKFFTI